MCISKWCTTHFYAKINAMDYIPSFTYSFSSLPLSTDVLWYIFFGIVLIFFFFSIFLVYHWFRYGMNIFASILATIIYAAVSVSILLIMLLSFAELIA